MAREFTDEQKKAWKEQMKEREDQAKEQIHDLARSFGTLQNRFKSS